MTPTDWIGFTGVTILLVAYFLNLINKMTKESIFYIFLNFAGAAIACVASWLLHYLPFIILEGTWSLVSFFALVSYVKKNLQKD